MTRKRKTEARKNRKLKNRELDNVKALKQKDMEEVEGGSINLTNNSGVDNQVGIFVNKERRSELILNPTVRQLPNKFLTRACQNSFID